MGLLGAIFGGLVGFALGGPVGAAIGAGLGATKVGEKVINKVMDFVLKPFLGALGVPDAGQYTAQREEGVLITKKGGGTEQIPIVYGFRQVGGIITFATTGSDRNRYLWVAYVLSEGPVEGIHSISIDDNDITSTDLIGALNRGEVYDINSGKYNGRVQMQFWYGANFGTNASSSPVGQYGMMTEAPGWRTTDAYNGLATLFVRYEWRQVVTQEDVDNNPFNGNIPNIKVNLLGKTVLPLDATAEGRDYITDINAGRLRYSTNPAEIIADYLRNPWYGKNLSNSEIDWASFRIARDKYNQDVTYVNGVRGPILTTNCVLDSGATLMTNVKTLLQGCRSYMPYVQGKYKLKVEDAGHPTDILSGSATVVKTFTSDNIVGDISYGGVPRDSVFSEYEVTYVDPNSKWATNTVVYPVTETERLAYQVIDGGRVNKGSTTFSTITNHAMAYDMARLLFNKSRQQETLNVKVTAEAFDLEPGDNIQVQGNTLSFTVGPSAIPWRIISIRANDDYTFDLGCVRNPDSIYPHTRAGERDIIIPPYIPRYDSIDYPITDVDLSLYPPSYAYVGTTPITSPLQPPGATDPTGPTGGGVGDQNGEQNQNPITVPPQPAPPPAEVFNHYIDITSVNYTVSGALASATISFTQPDSPSYAGVDFWLSSVGAREPFYTLPASTQIPGVGRPITYTISNLTHNQPYILVARVKYTNGNSSTFATRPRLNSSGTAGTGDIEDYPETAGQGWTPGAVSTYVNPKNTTFASITATASLDGSSNRVLAFTVRQDISVQAGGVNPEVSGLNIYYKLSANTYWKKFVYNFDGSYQFGSNYTFTPSLDLGIGNPSEPNASDNFDFVFRFTYRDSTESTVQWRYMNVDIQPSWNSSNVDNISENTTAATAPVIITEEQAPPGAVIDTRTMTIGLTQVAYVKTSRTYLQFTINPPDVSNQINWYGVKIRSRVIPIGATTLPSFDSVDVLNISSPWTFTLPVSGNISDNSYYQIAVTPLVRYSGARTETYTSWYGEGRVFEVRDPVTGFPDASANNSYFTRMNWRTIDTANITNGSIPLPPQDPKISVIRWQRVVNNSLSPRVNNIYYQLEYSIAHITSGSPSVRLYRRCWTLNPGTGATGSTAKYYGLGRWEYVDIVPGTNAQTLANGNIVVNLRCPIAPSEFNSVNTAGVTTPLENTSFSWGAGKKIIEDQAIEVIAVVTVGGVPSDFAIRLPRIIGTTVGTFTSPPPFAEVTTASFNNYDAGFKRNLTVGTDGARLAITGSAQWTSTSTALSNAYVAPSTNGGNGVI